MSENTDTPFGVPPVGFMQTGNQQFEMTSPAAELISTNFGETAPSAGMIDPFSTVGEANPFNPAIQPTTNQKYAIIDLFWLINQKFYATPKQAPAANEAHFVILSFNLDFGNMRISFFNLQNNSIQGNIIYLENCKRTVSGTIYPSTAFNIFNSQRLSTVCLEQLFKQVPGATWQQERPICTVQKHETAIRFNIKDPKYGEYFYDFTGWQREAFLHACNFTFNKGFELSAQKHIK
jgi:hypothetical protein